MIAKNLENFKLSMEWPFCFCLPCTNWRCMA